jgi:hypothetical protein
MSESRLEAFLARIYTDQNARKEFLANPSAVALKAGLEPNEIDAVVKIDRVGLELYARSLERKRESRSQG